LSGLQKRVWQNQTVHRNDNDAGGTNTELYSMRTDVTSTTPTTYNSRNFLPLRAGDLDYTRSAGGETGCFWSIRLSAATYPQ